MSLEDEIKELEEQLAKKKSEVKELEEKLEQLRAKTQGAKPKTVLGVPINTSGTGTKKKVIQQRIPTSGTSQIKYRETFGEKEKGLLFRFMNKFKVKKGFVLWKNFIEKKEKQGEKRIIFKPIFNFSLK